ncbi:MAG: DUF1573 domain-containing protein [Rikenellaceae bacterium]
MRYRLLILLFVFGFCGLVFSQTQSNDNIKFTQTSHNFGEIKEELGKVTATYQFKNVGKLPLLINSVSVSCGCTTASFPKEPIMPGKEAEIVVAFDPDSRPGFFDKKIIVVSDNRKKQDVLTITGKVIPRPLTISDKYPYSISKDILATSSYIEFGQIPVGYSHSLSLDLYNTSDRQITLSASDEFEVNELSYYIVNTVLKPRQSTQLIVNIDVENSVLYKIFESIIPIYVDGEVIESSKIKISGVSIPDVSNDINSKSLSSISLSETYHHFGTVYDGQYPVKEIKITNEGSSELKLLQIMVSDEESIKYTVSSTKIAPSESAILKVQYVTDGTLGRFNGDVMIISNDPSFPLSEIRIAANVRNVPEILKQ